MHPIPVQPKLYHITHVDNLASIVAGGKLWPYATILAKGVPTIPIGMTIKKQRRLRQPVKCHPGDYVGEYVPFYFCPRSIMLFFLSKGHRPEINYLGGQTPIIHMETDLDAAMRWANHADRRWAFTLSNAGAAYTDFYSHQEHLAEINWAGIADNDLRSNEVKESKQSEFLVRDFFPWDLIQRIGVYSASGYDQVAEMFANIPHPPRLEVRPEWYY